jgi:hypothetical protein
MANEIKDKFAAAAAFTCTLASLANGSARQSTLLANNGGAAGAAGSGQQRALVFVRLKSGGSAPTAGAVYEVYLLRNDGTIADDAAGASDAAITIENAPLLGTIVVTATTAKNFYGVFDTGPLGPLGSSWGIAIKNSSGQAISSTESDHAVRYTYVDPDIQAT